jgi:hypothetical protein
MSSILPIHKYPGISMFAVYEGDWIFMEEK